MIEPLPRRDHDASALPAAGLVERRATQGGGGKEGVEVRGHVAGALCGAKVEEHVCDEGVLGEDDAHEFCCGLEAAW